jgi:hypothetical protein
MSARSEELHLVGCAGATRAGSLYIHVFFLLPPSGHADSGIVGTRALEKELATTRIGIHNLQEYPEEGGRLCRLR